MEEALSPLAGDEKEDLVLLLVEDHFDVRLVVAECLRLEGFKVVEAVSAEEALVLADSGVRFDAVISDIDLGKGASGIELADWFAQRWPVLPVILTSGRINAHAVQSGELRRFLSKPYDISEVVSLIRRMVRGA